MKNRFLVNGILVVALCTTAFAQFGELSAGLPQSTYKLDDTVTINISPQQRTILPDAESALMIEFNAGPGWHFYADNKAVPTGRLSVTPAADGVDFQEAVFPASSVYEDEFSGKINVYKGKFKVYIPFSLKNQAKEKKNIPIKVDINGAACKDVCVFVNAVVSTTIDIDPAAAQTKAAFELPADQPKPASTEEAGPVDKTPAPMATDKHPVAAYFGLALVAGFLLNVMPCVWPMIPIIITRLWNLSGHSRAKSTAEGIFFSLGILLFFAVIATVNIVLRLGFGVVFQLGDHLRHPGFVTAMSMLMVALGMFMFGVFNISLPASVVSKASAGEERSGSVAMGFLLALLSTPCSFGILAAAFAWAQTQPLPMATFTIMLIGVGMAVPYLLLTSIPGLLNKLPKAGGWMERAKQAMGFLLLIIAIKLISAIPAEARINTIYYALILSFCIWMWGGWVTYSTKKGRKYFVRIAALVIAIAGGWLFLGTAEQMIEWKEYDPVEIAKTVESRQPVLIEFTADWCTTCTVVEKLVYNRKDIAALVKQKGVTAYKADTTLGEYQATMDLEEIYNEPGVPVSILYLPDGNRIHLRGMFDKDELKRYLEPLKNIEELNGQENREKENNQKETESS